MPDRERLKRFAAEALIVLRLDAGMYFRSRILAIQAAFLVLLYPVIVATTQLRHYTNGFQAAYAPLALGQVGLFPYIGGLQATIGSFAGERERKTLGPLLSTPLSSAAIFFGKVLAMFLPTVAYSMVSIALAIGLSYGADGNVGPLGGYVPVLELLWVCEGFGLAMICGAVAMSTRLRSMSAAAAASTGLMLPVFGGALGIAYYLATNPITTVLVTGAVVLLAITLLLVYSRAWRRNEILVR